MSTNLYAAAADQIRDAYPGDIKRGVLGSPAGSPEANLSALTGSYVSGVDRNGSHSGNYMSTMLSYARPGNYTSTIAPSYEIRSYIDVEPRR